MRTALLTTALMMVATMAWADEPTAPATTAEATATATKPAEQATATTETATAAVATADDKKPLRPPQGYRPKRVNGEQVWCAKQVVLGSKFPREDCRNEAELRELIRTRESMRTDMEQRLRTCTTHASGACGMN
ncbi:MAG TPA: hypothetical protein VFV69_21060 [Steroidobacteraceae bacterium]|jgi:hypothetical protein|nr:hypothetical protein [Steroidobacteraceae bacterium]